MLISEEQKRRYTAFWDRTPTDRACIYVTAWDGAPGFRAPVSVEEQWGGLAYREEQVVYNTRHTRYFAEGFPTVFTNFGPGSFGACVGGGFRFAPSTVWFEMIPHFAEDWNTRPHLKLDRNSAMYRMSEEYSERLLSHKDLFFTSIVDMGGTFDIIAALRGTENLLYDFYDNPDEIKALYRELFPLIREYYQEQTARLFREQGAMTSWMPIWSDKPYYPLQCDMCTMISPKMFGEYILPDLRAQTEYMERAIYHLDGPDELPHLDQLLSLPRLNAIQWTPGDGNPPISAPCWYPVYRKIQEAGKGLILLGVSPDQLEAIFTNVSQRGLYLTTWARDEKDAADMVRLAERLNH